MNKLLTCLFVISSVFCCSHLALAADPIVYEFESYEETANKIKDHEQASGGKYVQVSERSKSTEHSVTVPVEVKAGEYILEFAASEETKNSANSAGPMYFQVDDGEEVKVSSSTCTFTDITPVYPSAVFRMSKIQYKTAIALSEGAHTIKVTLRPNSDTEKTKGALDYLSLTKDGDDYPVITDGLLFEAENAGDSRFIADVPEASGGKVQKIMYTNAEQTFEYKFTSESEMDVNLELAAAEGAFVGNHLSYVYFTLNDQAEVKIGSVNASNAGSLFTSDFTVNQLKYKTALSLKKGVNTLTIRIPVRETFNGDAVFCVFDYVSLRKVKEVTALTSDIPQTVKRGERIPLNFKNQDSESIASEDLDSIEVSFENEYIGDFANGAAYARNYGKTNLLITAQKGGNSFSLTAPIEVISETGLSVIDAKREEKKITLTFRANGNYAGGDRIFIAAYHEKNGMLSSVTELLSEGLTAITDGETVTVEKELQQDADKVSVYIMNGSDSESAINRKITL